jgi:DtxR family Mn-dependent transcriptional regulator
MAKRLSPSLEDYLEAAYTLCVKDGFARASDVSRLLKVSRPSVSSAAKTLSARGLLTQERYGLIRLSPAGLRTGGEIARRHGTLKAFFVEVLALDATRAELDACRAEHALSGEALRRVGALTVFLKAPARRALLRAARRALSGRKA